VPEHFSSRASPVWESTRQFPSNRKLIHHRVEIGDFRSESLPQPCRNEPPPFQTLNLHHKIIVFRNAGRVMQDAQCIARGRIEPRMIKRGQKKVEWILKNTVETET